MKRILSILLILTAFLASCTRDILYEGPSLNDLYGEFELLEDFKASNENIDFANGETTYFTAKFSKTCKWQLTITGLTSGAQKIIEGKSYELNIDNSKWDGSTTVFPMFGAEQCKVQLFIESDSVYLYDTVKIATTKTNDGVLIADFETGLNPDWDIFAQTGANMSFYIKIGAAPQGYRYFDMGGTVSWDWLIGMIDFPASANGANNFGLSSNPNNIYFNVLLCVPEGISNEMVLIRFSEDENSDGTFDDSSEDLYSVQLEDLEHGWQLVSIKYSDLECLVDGNASTPNGNGLHNPELLTQVSVLMLADPTSGYSQTLMDYLIFTEGAPLKP